MPQAHRACETCAYFEADPNRDQGECRRHAPKHGTTNAMWPKISKYALCGEYRYDDPQPDIPDDVAF